MKKEQRFKIIEDILISEDIETQEDLVVELKKRNIEVTQATISRDINELKLVKVPAKNGNYKYSIASHQNDNFKNMVISIKMMREMLSFKSNPGHAMLLKKLLQEKYEDKIFSILADDDSVLLIASNEEDAYQIKSQLGGD